MTNVALWRTALVGLAVLLPSRGLAEGFFLEGRAGFGGLGGDVGEAFSSGLLLGGLAGYELENNLALEGDVSLLIVEAESNGADLTFDDAGFISFLGGVRLYLMPPSASARFFLGGGAGFSVLAWDYTPLAEILNGVDSDAVGAVSLYGKSGVQFAVSEAVSLGAEARVVLNAWGDETSEGFAIETDGHSFQGSGALRIAF